MEVSSMVLHPEQVIYLDYKLLQLIGITSAWCKSPVLTWDFIMQLLLLQIGQDQHLHFKKSSALGQNSCNCAMQKLIQQKRQSDVST